MHTRRGRRTKRSSLEAKAITKNAYKAWKENKEIKSGQICRRGCCECRWCREGPQGCIREQGRRRTARRGRHRTAGACGSRTAAGRRKTGRGHRKTGQLRRRRTARLGRRSRLGRPDQRLGSRPSSWTWWRWPREQNRRRASSEWFGRERRGQVGADRFVPDRDFDWRDGPWRHEGGLVG